MRGAQLGAEYDSVKQSRRVRMTQGLNADNSGKDDLDFVRSLTNQGSLRSSEDTEDPYQPSLKKTSITGPELPTKELGSIIRKVLAMQNREANSKPKTLFNTLSTFKGAKINFLQISPDMKKILLC